MADIPNFIKLKNQSGSEDTHYSIFYKGIPEEYRQYAKEALNETDENKQKGLEKLKAFLERENLAACTDDDIILALRCAKYDTDKAKKKLRKFLEMRQITEELLSEMDKRKAEFILDDVIFGFLPYRDKYGRAILFSRPNLRFDLYDADDFTPLVYAMLLYTSSIPLSAICGVSYIMECKTDSIYDFYPLAKFFKKRLFPFVDFPIRYERVDSVNPHKIFRICFKMLSPFLPVKLRKRLCMHDDDGYETLKKFYHPDLLPEELGGNCGPIPQVNKSFREGLLDFIEKLNHNKQTRTKLPKL